MNNNSVIICDDFPNYLTKALNKILIKIKPQSSG